MKDGIGKTALVKESTVRVPAGRLDRLVNLVGELVMNQSRVTQAASQVGAPELVNPVQEMERLVAELREDVLGIRMLPIGIIFGRFRRLVHDLSTELGKEADLITEGAETELDKSILDQLGEPLVHLLRNSMDHGFGRPEERIASGKPRRGTIRLAAEHTGSDIVITIEDDGRGIDRAAVRAKAVEKHAHRAGRRPQRQRDTQSYSIAGILHRRPGNGRIRPWRRDGRGQETDRRPPRLVVDRECTGPWLPSVHHLASDVGDH